MISGKLNSEKIWHENLTGLSTSPVRCSHFTLGNPKSRFLSLAAAALLSVELILIVFYVNKYITIKYCSSFAATIIIPLPYGLHWLSVRHRVNFSVKFKKHGIRVFAGALRPGEKCQQSVTEHFQAETKTHYSAPSRWAGYCDEPSVSVCLYVYVRVFVYPRSLCLEPRVQSLLIFVNITRSSSGGVVISYVLPELWMTSSLHIMALATRKKRSLEWKWLNRGSTDLALRRILNWYLRLIVCSGHDEHHPVPLWLSVIWRRHS